MEKKKINLYTLLDYLFTMKTAIATKSTFVAVVVVLVQVLVV